MPGPRRRCCPPGRRPTRRPARPPGRRHRDRPRNRRRDRPRNRRPRAPLRPYLRNRAEVRPETRRWGRAADGGGVIRQARLRWKCTQYQVVSPGTGRVPTSAARALPGSLGIPGRALFCRPTGSSHNIPDKAITLSLRARAQTRIFRGRRGGGRNWAHAQSQEQGEPDCRDVRVFEEHGDLRGSKHAGLLASTGPWAQRPPSRNQGGRSVALGFGGPPGESGRYLDLVGSLRRSRVPDEEFTDPAELEARNAQIREAGEDGNIVIEDAAFGPDLLSTLVDFTDRMRRGPARDKLAAQASQAVVEIVQASADPRILGTWARVRFVTESRQAGRVLLPEREQMPPGPESLVARETVILDTKTYPGGALLGGRPHASSGG